MHDFKKEMHEFEQRMHEFDFRMHALIDLCTKINVNALVCGRKEFGIPGH
jgi:hypothetical protein